MAVRFPGISTALPRLPKPQTGTSSLRPVPSLINKPLVLSLDIDGTLIPWQGQPHYDEVAVQRYSHALNQPEIKDNAFVMLNTGRGLSAIQALIPILKKFPVDALGLNDGQQLFLHERTTEASSAESKPNTETWLRSLSTDQEDSAWNEQLQGWSTTTVMQTASRELPKLGFALQETNPSEATESMEGMTQLFTKPIDPHQPSGPQWLVKFYPDQAYMEVTRSDHKAEREAIATCADQLGAHFQKTLQSDWPKASYYTNITPTSTYVHLGPAGNSKGNLVHYLVETRCDPKPKAVISAGDSFNDREILSVDAFGETPNYPVQVGKHPALSAYLDTHRPERLEQTEASQLDTGLAAQFTKLKGMLPFLQKPEPIKTSAEPAETVQEAIPATNKLDLLA